MNILNNESEFIIELERTEVTDKMLAFIAYHDIFSVLTIQANVGEITIRTQLSNQESTNALLELSNDTFDDLTHYIKCIANTRIVLRFDDELTEELFVKLFS